MIRIAEILPDSIAEELQLRIGSRIVRINGEPVRDTIDFRFMEADGRLELEVHEAEGRNGDVVVYDIEKDAAEGLGVIPAPDTVRECANKCVFCFIDGNPPAARRSLHLKDDDFRLSFTYGSYVTLTNLGPRGFQRLLDQRLSPLYVSVHATEPAVRMKLLGVPRGGDIMERLDELTSAGIEVHTQVVLCPDWNDGVHLDRTIDDLWSLGPRVLSLSVVPVGLTRYNLGRPARLLTDREARDAIAQVERARVRSRRARGAGWAYAADEMFLLADRPVPDPAYYDDWPLTENGVGAVRAFLEDIDGMLREPPSLEGRRIRVITGWRMGGVIAPLLSRLETATGASFTLVPVENRYFGPSVTTAGLLAGADILDAVRRAAGPEPADVTLVPAEALNDDGVLIDSMAFEHLAGELTGDVIPAYSLGTALRNL